MYSNIKILVILVAFISLEYAVQGAPSQKLQPTGVKCGPNSKNIECIRQAVLKKHDGVTNWIPSLIPKPNEKKIHEDVFNIFPISEHSGDEPGSGSESESKTNTEEPGSGMEDNPDFSEYAFPERMPRKSLDENMNMLIL